jgi:hypothetical protein
MIDLNKQKLSKGQRIWMITDNGVPSELVSTGEVVAGYQEFITPDDEKIYPLPECKQIYGSLEEVINYFANDLRQCAKHNPIKLQG